MSAEHWDQQAPTYDRKIAWVDRRFLAASRHWVCAQARGLTLEACIGTGGNLAYYPEGVDLTGHDGSAGMLDVARRRAQEMGRAPVLARSDVAALPFGDGEFDTVVCTYALCSVPDDGAALAEFRRVLRPGGTLLLADHVVSTVAPARGVQRAIEHFSRRDGEYVTRRPILRLPGLGFDVAVSERFHLGIIERVRAVRRD